MRIRSWSEIAREYSDRVVRRYNNKDSEEKIKYRDFLFCTLFVPVDGKYWRNPLIQHRIAKRLHRKLKMF